MYVWERSQASESLKGREENANAIVMGEGWATVGIVVDEASEGTHKLSP